MLTEEQLLKRKESIGGSDIGAICGFSSFKSPLDIFYEKTNKDAPSERSSNLLKIGNAVEQTILDWYTEETGNELMTLDTVKADYRHMNVDGFCQQKGIIVEAKFVMDASQWGESGVITSPATVPLAYTMQVAHGCSVFDDAKFADVQEAHIIAVNRFSFELIGIYKYRRNPEFERKLKSKAQDFWYNHVVPETPPTPLTSSELNRHWMSEAGKFVSAPVELIDKANAIRNLKRKMKEMKSQVIGYENDIKSYMQDASQLMAGAHLLATWDSHARKSVDVELLKTKFPEVYEQVLRETTVRPLNVKDL